MRTALVALLLLVVPACAHNPVAAKPAVTGAPTASSSSGAKSSSLSRAPEVASAAAAGPSCGKDDDCHSAELCIRSQCVAIDRGVELAECSDVRVHFDFDAWLLKPDDQPRLERVARCLKADQKLHVTIQGNADERGTEEYNLALGQKRAVEVQKVLEAMGVSDKQLATISYGFERPLCTEHDEVCWSQNRRAGLHAN